MTTRKRWSSQNQISVNGKLIEDKAGWKKIHIYGEPYERGFAHGVLLFRELNRIKKGLAFIVYEYFGMDLFEYVKQCNQLIMPIVKVDYTEFFTELEGISAGAKRKGIIISTEFLVAWNSILSIFNKNKKNERCSAFIATGSATKKGDIVMAHNTHSDFFTGQLLNIILKVTPSQGQEFTMQTSPGYIASSADWFICANGIIGCETTITQFKKEPNFKTGTPYFCRIRQAMQYANTLDDYIKTMTEHNSGDYACSWLFGDTRTDEIMQLELGLDVYSVNRTQDGVYYGANSAFDLKLRQTETNDVDHDNPNASVGARTIRLNHLLNEEYYGKIDIPIAKRIMSDHYSNVGSLNVCNHCEIDETCKYTPYGSTDAKVTDTSMVRTMSFYGRFGSGCGRIFNIAKYVKAHPEHKKWATFLKDIPNNKWTRL